jgi:hypothetical protein
MSTELILFSTDHCTFCDQALELLLSMPELAGHAVRVVDVAESDTLLETLGTRVPVLEFRPAGGSPHQLDWPFTSTKVSSLLGALRTSPEA